MSNQTVLQTCPVCLKGPVVQRDSSSMLGLRTKTEFVCETCGSVLHPLKGGRYRYTAISADYPDMRYHQKTVFESLEQLRALAVGRVEQYQSQQRIAAQEEAKRRLQPKTLDQFLGQRHIKEQLPVSIQAPKTRGEALGHILLHGPEGCGKKTLAVVVAKEMGSRITRTSGQAIEGRGDLAAIITNLGQQGILFIDDIHDLRRGVEERLCQAMKDYVLDITIGKGRSAKIIHLALPHITVIGATDQPNRVSPRLRRSFHHIFEFEVYDRKALGQLVHRRAEVLGIDIENEACWEIGRGAKGTISEAERLLDRARDYAEVKGDGIVTLDIARWAVHGTVPTPDRRDTEPISLTWQEFEGFVADLFKNLGYQNVRLTPRAGDEGKDIVMEWADPLRGTRRLYVECKHWKTGSVGRRQVQVLHSAVMANPEVEEGVIVTTGSFTDGAVDYAKQVGLIQLVDRKRLRELMARAGMQGGVEDTDSA